MKQLLIVIFCLAPATVLANHHEGKKEPSKEQRVKMADMHTRMAECLRSDKAIKDCRKEMKESCKSAGEGMCPMMKRIVGNHKGKGHDHDHDHGEDDAD